MFVLHFCLPKPKWNRSMFLICHSEAGALRVAEDFHLVTAKLTRKQRRQNRCRLCPLTTGSLGNRKTEHMTHFQIVDPSVKSGAQHFCPL